MFSHTVFLHLRESGEVGSVRGGKGMAFRISRSLVKMLLRSLAFLALMLPYLFLDSMKVKRPGGGDWSCL